MTTRYIEYPLDQGYIQNWLAAGPQLTQVEASSAGDWKAKLAQPQAGTALEFPEPPVDRGTSIDSLNWRYVRCQTDHFVDLSQFVPTPSSLSAWAYTQLETGSATEKTLTLQSYGPAQVWINGEQAYQGIDFTENDSLQSVEFKVQLKESNEIAVHFLQAGVRAVPLAVSLRVSGEDTGMRVRVPVQARFPNRIQKYEQIFEKAYLEEAAAYKGRVINLHFAEGANTEMRYHYSVQDADAMIYVEGTWDVDLEKPLDVGHPQRIFERPARVVLRAPAKEYFDQGLRVQQDLPVYMIDNAYSTEPYGSYPNRRQEALEDAVRRDGLLFSEIARMALNKWDKVEVSTILAATEAVKARTAGSELLLVGLLGMAARFEQDPSFPSEVLEPLAQAAVHYAYQTQSDLSGVDFKRESSQILLHTAAILAGQRYADQEFSVSHLTGAQLQSEAETQASEWILARGRNGFMEWNSPEAVDRNIVALSHLVSLAKNDSISDLAAVLMDKVLFLLANRTFLGVVGGSEGRASAVFHSAALKSARLQASAGITRLFFGMGIYTAQNAGVISLTLSDYEFPSFFLEMSALPPEESWSRESNRDENDEVNLAFYKTRDYLLGSAQSYHPGERGEHALIWQAVMGPETLVFVNHPTAFCQGEERQPGFWLGNGSLPRTAQWKDALISVYNIPEGEGLDFTHAFFPVYMFDEYYIEGNWIFGRKGEGYIALTAANGLDLVKEQPDGYRELRSQGRKNVWLCQMGRVETDGNFLQFRQKVSKLNLEWTDLGVTFTSLRDETLKFGWEGDFSLDGKLVPLSGFAHIDNSYCKAALPADVIDITYGEYVLRLSFE